jgi:hypothetical protein
MYQITILRGSVHFLASVFAPTSALAAEEKEKEQEKARITAYNTRYVESIKEAVFRIDNRISDTPPSSPRALADQELVELGSFDKSIGVVSSIRFKDHPLRWR